MIEENIAMQMADPVFEKVNEQIKKDNTIAEKCVNEFADVLNKFIKEDKEFSSKHGFIALGRTLVYLTQTLCKDAEHFESEIEKANALMADKMMLSLMPLTKDGKIVEENFDIEDVSVRRVLMALGCGVDYVFWRNELSSYSEKRSELEEDSTNEEKVEEN